MDPAIDLDEPFAPNVGENCGEAIGVSGREARVWLGHFGQKLLLHIARRKGRYDQTGSTDNGRQPPRDLQDIHDCTLAGGEALQEQDVLTLEHSQLSVLLDSPLNVFHEGKGRVAQIQGFGAPGGEFPEADTCLDAGPGLIQDAQAHHLVHYPVGAGDWELGPSSNFGGRQRGLFAIEHCQNPHGPAQAGFPRCRFLHGPMVPQA